MVKLKQLNKSWIRGAGGSLGAQQMRSFYSILKAWGMVTGLLGERNS
jgi:hypothetical protein